jgi:hypothetical protein
MGIAWRNGYFLMTELWFYGLLALLYIVFIVLVYIIYSTRLKHKDCMQIVANLENKNIELKKEVNEHFVLSNKYREQMKLFSTALKSCEEDKDIYVAKIKKLENNLDKSKKLTEELRKECTDKDKQIANLTTQNKKLYRRLKKNS